MTERNIEIRTDAARNHDSNSSEYEKQLAELRRKLTDLQKMAQLMGKHQ